MLPGKRERAPLASFEFFRRNAKGVAACFAEKCFGGYCWGNVLRAKWNAIPGDCCLSFSFSFLFPGSAAFLRFILSERKK